MVFPKFVDQHLDLASHQEAWTKRLSGMFRPSKWQPSLSVKPSEVVFSPEQNQMKTLHAFCQSLSQDYTLWMGKPAPSMGYSARLKDVDDDQATSILKALKTFPAIESLIFSGWGDPLLSKHLGMLIQCAFEFSGAYTRILSHGLVGPEPALQLEIFDSSVEVIEFNLIAHKPSVYSAITQRPASEYIERVRNIRAWCEARKVFPKSKTRVIIRFTLDFLTLRQAPQMIQLVESWGVDEVIFDNHLPFGKSVVGSTLLVDQPNIRQTLKYLQNQTYGVKVQWPPLLSVENHIERACQSPYQMLSLNSDGYISPCMTHQVFQSLILHVEDDVPVEESHQFKLLRDVHQKNSQQPLPEACQICPMACEGIQYPVVTAPKNIELKQVEVVQLPVLQEVTIHQKQQNAAELRQEKTQKIFVEINQKEVSQKIDKITQRKQTNVVLKPVFDNRLNLSAIESLREKQKIYVGLERQARVKNGLVSKHRFDDALAVLFDQSLEKQEQNWFE